MLNQALGGVGRRVPGRGISAGMKSMRFLRGSPAGLLGNSQPEALEDTQVSRKAAAAWEQPHTEAQTCCSAQSVCAARVWRSLAPDDMFVDADEEKSRAHSVA